VYFDPSILRIKHLFAKLKSIPLPMGWCKNVLLSVNLRLLTLVYLQQGQTKINSRMFLIYLACGANLLVIGKHRLQGSIASWKVNLQMHLFFT